MHGTAQKLYSAAADVEAAQGVEKALAFLDLGGTITPPSDDPTDWWEPENLTHRAELVGVRSSGRCAFDTVMAWLRIAKATQQAKQRRATDGRPDCPYNGQGLAPPSPAIPAA